MDGQGRKEAMRIGGQRVSTHDVIEVRYPFTGELVGTVPAGAPEHVAQAFDIAASYVSTLTRHARQNILLRAAGLIRERRDDLARLLVLELGICLQHAVYETTRACDVFTLAGHQALMDEGEIFSCDLTENGKPRKIFTKREPVRAISAITPFNHPLNMVAHKIAPSVATNNCLVCKPSEHTPLSALALADILYEAGLPPEMFQVVTGRPEDIGSAMVTDPRAEVVSFTGGLIAGRAVAAQSGMKRTALELGGNDPLIILNDLAPADLERAADLAVAGATGNSGQRCTAVKRVLVQESVAEKVVARILERARALRFGDPMNPDTELGCVVHEAAAKEMERRVADAKQAGAIALYDPGRQGALMPPVVLDRVPVDAELVVDETFGPIIPILRVPDDDREVIACSNSTAFGLSAGVCTNSWPRAQRFIDRLDVGTVNIWEQPGFRTEMSPFGGVKASGNGVKEGVREAMKFFTNVKTYSLPWN